MTKGTPKTLLEACENGRIAAQWTTERTADEELFLHIKDFLSQKFSVALCKAQNDEELTRLKTLWIRIIDQDQL
jgi:hypothetical protein